jgi:hypothetical protein
MGAFCRMRCPRERDHVVVLPDRCWKSGSGKNRPTEFDVAKSPPARRPPELDERAPAAPRGDARRGGPTSGPPFLLPIDHREARRRAEPRCPPCASGGGLRRRRRTPIAPMRTCSEIAHDIASAREDHRPTPRQTGCLGRAQRRARRPSRHHQSSHQREVGAGPAPATVRNSRRMRGKTCAG